ncbi:hypothetical protein JCM14076_16700 [Methylosoma difficile]
MLDEAAIIDFWFKEISPEDWWKKDATFDHAIKNRFLNIHQAASRGELAGVKPH